MRWRSATSVDGLIVALITGGCDLICVNDAAISCKRQLLLAASMLAFLSHVLAVLVSVNNTTATILLSHQL